MRGTIETLTVKCSLLKGFSRAGVKAERPLLIYTPPEVLTAADPVPVLYCLAPWTNAGRALFDWKPFRESLPERIDRLIAAGTLPPVILAAPDFYSEVFGGSQYVDSGYLGPQAQCMIEEIFPFVEARYPVRQGASGRVVFGRSSGGYGALRMAMDYPGSVAAVGAHSSDMGFELLYGADLLALVRALARFRGSVDDYLADLAGRSKIGGGDMHVLMYLGMAATYSPNPDSGWGFDLPIDLYTGKLLQDVLARWRDHDPVTMAEQKLANLSRLAALYIECGTKDQYNLLYGNRQLRERLQNLKVAHRYEEFDDNHAGTDYRFDVSLPFLVENLIG